MLTRFPALWTALLVLPAFAFAADAPAEPEPRAAKTQEVTDFSLLDYQGRNHELHRVDAKVVVLFITGNGCPIARQSINKLHALRWKFARQGVEFWMLNANLQDDRQGVAEEALKFNFGTIPVLMDEQQHVARALSLTRTAEAIAIETKNWSIVYRGAIDDQLSEGASKPQPGEEYLARALTEFLAGQTVTQPKAPVKGCLIKFDNEPKTDDPPISYAKVIAPLLQQKCVDCHSPGNIGPFAMSSHRKIKGWSEMIREVILARRMPPWHADPHYGKFSNDRSLTAAETSTLLRWIAQDCPHGDGDDPLAVPLPKLEEWPLGQPDHLVTLPKPETIPANGVLLYRYIDSPFVMPEDGWLRACVIHPGNRKIVHHVILRTIYPAGYQGKRVEEMFLAGWAPGYKSPAYPAGTGKFVPKGARFNFELHYTTIGREETDNTQVGFYLAKEPPGMVLETRTAENMDFSIPPGEPDARSHSMVSFQRDTIIYELIPHMHLRGSWFKYEALYPDGKKETLLSVPNYDFKWQTEYRFTEPKRVPAGTWLFCTGGFDNSAKNPNNPDPTQRVTHGFQSFEEMFSGFMTIAEVPASPGETPRQAKVEGGSRDAD